MAELRLEYELAKLEPAMRVDSPVAYVDVFGIFLFFALALAIIYKGIPNLPIAFRPSCPSLWQLLGRLWYVHE